MGTQTETSSPDKATQVDMGTQTKTNPMVDKRTQLDSLTLAEPVSNEMEEELSIDRLDIERIQKELSKGSITSEILVKVRSTQNDATRSKRCSKSLTNSMIALSGLQRTYKTGAMYHQVDRAVQLFSNQPCDIKRYGETAW